jgi:hypothetical protein
VTGQRLAVDGGAERSTRLAAPAAAGKPNDTAV